MVPTSNHVSANVLIVRALKTFIQAFAAAVAAGVVAAVSVPTTKALLIGALGAGFSAVMNLFIAPQEAK